LAAAAAYQRLVGGPAAKAGDKPAPGALPIDTAVARFHLAERLAETAAQAGAGAAAAREKAYKAFVALNTEFPAHPLGDEAGRRAAALAPPSPPTPTAGGGG
jgi:hypothetical protein